MNKGKYITKLVMVLLMVVSVKFTGCEQEDLNFYIDCDYCLEFIPDSADLIVYVTIDDENPFVPLSFYIGDYEDGVVDYVDTTWTEEYLLLSKVGIEYSVTAMYQKDGVPVIAIDGDKLKVVNGAGDCYSPCYFIRAGTLDVRLK